MVEKVLATQLLHDDEPSRAHVPAEHEWQTMALVAPSNGEDVPPGQFVHALAPAYEYVPGVQMSTRISSLMDCEMVTCCRFASVSSAESWLARMGVFLLLMSTFTAICCWASVSDVATARRKHFVARKFIAAYSHRVAFAFIQHFLSTTCKKEGAGSVRLRVNHLAQLLDLLVALDQYGLEAVDLKRQLVRLSDA